MKTLFSSRFLTGVVLAGVLTAAVWASSCGDSGTVTPVVPPPPPPPPPPPLAQIKLEPAAVSFTDTAGTTDSTTQTITVSAVAGTLTDLSLGTITYAGTGGWLSASLSGPLAPATLTLTARTAGLAAGSYSATIPVRATATNTPQTVSVSFMLAAAPPPPPPPPPPVSGAVVVLTGNLGSCGSDLAHKSSDVVAAANPYAVFVLGDIAPARSGLVPTLQDFQDCYEPNWGRFKSITYAAMGDHDQDSATGIAAGADAYFGVERAGPPGANYYSFNIGDWHVVVLNAVSGGPERPVPYNLASEQAAWLWRDLSDNRNKRCTLAVWHDPMWISSSEPPTATDTLPNHAYRDQPMRALWMYLYYWGADVVVNGGRHIYERFAPLRYFGTYTNPDPYEFRLDSAYGMRQFSTGLGGDGPLSTPSVAVTHPLSEYRSGGNGVLKLTLGNGEYSWEFLNTSWSSIQDRGNGSCHDKNPDEPSP